MILLNIQASPRGSRSISIAATDAFVEAYRTAHPDVRVDNLNVWEEGLPEFDSEAIGAKYKGVAKAPMNDAESAIWKSIQSLAARFQGCRFDCAWGAYVELRLSLQAETVDRSRLPAQLSLHL